MLKKCRCRNIIRTQVVFLFENASFHQIRFPQISELDVPLVSENRHFLEDRARKVGT